MMFWMCGECSRSVAETYADCPFCAENKLNTWACWNCDDLFSALSPIVIGEHNYCSDCAQDQNEPILASISRLPADPTRRKALPITTGVLDYFPDAIAAVAAVSRAGNDQHNPGEELHWARGKSMDQADTIVRHLMDRGSVDTDGHRHSAKAAWRALALLQLEIEAAEGLPPSRGSK